MSRQVHTVRFYSLEPNGIKCMSLEKTVKLLAVSRQDNSIEIWSVSHTPHIQTTISGTFGTIEGLAWYNKRLFSVGLQGSIIEYDLRKQEPKSMHPISSSSCWCLSVHQDKKQLAAGTEEGYINIFDLTDKELVYNKIMDKQEGRISCISWDSSGNHLITGSIDTIRVWKVSTGHAIHRLLTGRDMNRKETIVWSLAVTDDFTIITGDSRGKLCFWDGNVGICVATYQSHKSDILSVCLSEDQNIVYCAGVDPQIASYERVKMRGNEEQVKWVKSIERAIHDHDVRCLVTFSNNKLFSAGLDGYLALSSYPPKVLIKYPPILQPPSVQLASEVKLMLLRYPKSVTIWKLQIGRCPIKFIEWKAPPDLRVKAADISANGLWLACSTQARLRLYYIKNAEHPPKLIQKKVRTNKSLASHCLTFSADSKTLVLGTLEGRIYVLGLETQSPIMKYVFRPHVDNHFQDNLGNIVVSEDASFIVAADLSSNIVVWSNGKLYCKLPVHKCPLTSMAIQPRTNYLVLVYADHQILEYSLENMKYTEYSRRLQDHYPNEWLTRNFAVHSITFDYKNPDIIILSDDSAVLVINKREELPLSDCKIPRLGTNSNPGSPSRDGSDDYPHSTYITQNPVKSTRAFQIIKRYKHLVFYGALCDGELVAVELSPASIKEKLPPTTRKLFGRM